MEFLDSEWALPAGVVLWLLFSAFLSVFGGWHELAERFADGKTLHGDQFWVRSGAIGWKLFPVNYGNCLFVTVGADGFALSIVLLLRFMHPRLVIPWSAVERCEPVKFWLVHHVAVHITGFTRRLWLSGNLGQKILDTWTTSQQTRAPAVYSATSYFGSQGNFRMPKTMSPITARVNSKIRLQ
jgi:hypothetical protein